MALKSVKYIEIDDQRGALYSAGKQSLLIPVTFIKAIDSIFVRLVGRKGADILIYKIGEALGREYAQTLKTILKKEETRLSPEMQVSIAYNAIFMEAGWGQIHIQKIDLDEQMLEAELCHSPSIEFLKKSEYNLERGVLAGVYEEITKEKIYCQLLKKDKRKHKIILRALKEIPEKIKEQEKLVLLTRTVLEEIQEANSRLRKLDNAKSEFITIASHKLRTPMTAIKGFTSMLLEGAYGKLPDKHKDVLNKIYMSNDRLITLAEDLLNVSRIESGKMEYSYEKVNIPNLAKEVFDTFFIAAKEKNLDFTLLSSQDPLPEVTTDRKKLREVISDIVDNAIRYTPQGGIVISFSQDKSFLTISVKDTGIGISKEEASSLFNKFSRGEDVSLLNTEGNGLGLHVGQGIMQTLGGKITFSSEGKGKGATFNILVPVRGKRLK